MKRPFLFCVLLSMQIGLMFSDSFAQQDTTQTIQRTRSFSGGSGVITPNQKQIIVNGNVSFTTSNLIMTALEREICDLEAKECMALQKRDTATLRKLWFRDFTLDYPKELVAGSNPIPYYVSYSRMVEKFSPFSNVVYTSGYETFNQLNAKGELAGLTKRTYSHTWTRVNGVWKLTSKTRG